VLAQEGVRWSARKYTCPLRARGRSSVEIDEQPAATLDVLSTSGIRRSAWAGRPQDAICRRPGKRSAARLDGLTGVSGIGIIAAACWMFAFKPGQPVHDLLGGGLEQPPRRDVKCGIKIGPSRKKQKKKKKHKKPLGGAFNRFGGGGPDCGRSFGSEDFSINGLVDAAYVSSRTCPRVSGSRPSGDRGARPRTATAVSGACLGVSDQPVGDGLG